MGSISAEDSVQLSDFLGGYLSKLASECHSLRPIVPVLESGLIFPRGEDIGPNTEDIVSVRRLQHVKEPSESLD